MITDLAFDAHGELLELPATAAFWKGRRFRNVGSRGAPKVAFVRDGLPLILPIDTELAELAVQLERVPGRYRQDLLDHRQRAVPVPGVAAAELHMSEPPRMPAGAGEEHSMPIRELARANAEADGAGRSALTGPVPETRNRAAGDNEEDEKPRSEIAEIIRQAMALAQLAVMRILNRCGGEPRGTRGQRALRRPGRERPASRVATSHTRFSSERSRSPAPRTGAIANRNTIRYCNPAASARRGAFLTTSLLGEARC